MLFLTHLLLFTIYLITYAIILSVLVILLKNAHKLITIINELYLSSIILVNFIRNFSCFQ